MLIAVGFSNSNCGFFDDSLGFVSVDKVFVYVSKPSLQPLRKNESRAWPVPDKKASFPQKIFRRETNLPMPVFSASKLMI
jgi:hypothetical protein